MKEKSLYTEIEFSSFGTSITVTCPDEDNEICITIVRGDSNTYVLSLDDAEQIGEFILEHVKNARKQ